MARHLSFRYFFVADCVPIVNKGRNQTGNGSDRCPGHNPATRLRPLPVYSAARQRSAPKPRPESASPSSSQVRTPAFQAGNTGSNPVGDTIAPSGAMSAPAGFGRRASPAARCAGSNPSRRNGTLGAMAATTGFGRRASPAARCAGSNPSQRNGTLGAMSAPAGFGRRASPAARCAGSNPSRRNGTLGAMAATTGFGRRASLRLGALGRIPHDATAPLARWRPQRDLGRRHSPAARSAGSNLAGDAMAPQLWCDSASTQKTHVTSPGAFPTGSRSTRTGGGRVVSSLVFFPANRA